MDRGKASLFRILMVSRDIVYLFIPAKLSRERRSKRVSRRVHAQLVSKFSEMPLTCTDKGGAEGTPSAQPFFQRVSRKSFE